jgi:hypothetical protein
LSAVLIKSFFVYLRAVGKNWWIKLRLLMLNRIDSNYFLGGLVIGIVIGLALHSLAVGIAIGVAMGLSMGSRKKKA